MDMSKIFESSHFAPEQIEEIKSAFSPIKYAQDEFVFKEGEDSDTFYIIKSGQAFVSKQVAEGNEVPLGILKEGQCFGEIGLLEEMDRTASVKALGELELFQLKKEGFGDLLERSDAFSILLKKISRNRLLKQTSIFKQLSDLGLLAVQELMFEKDFEANEVVFEENDPPDALYIIAKGSAQITRRTKSGKNITLAFLGQGNFFGEMGLIETQPRSATVTTTEPSKMLVLPRDEFQELLQKSPLISLNIMKVLSQRLRDNDRERTRDKEVSLFKGMTIVTRPEKCLACKACEMACAVSKSRTNTLYGALYEEPPPVKRIHVRRTQYGASEPIIRPEHCLHCPSAPCLTSCKFKAIKRDAITKTIVIEDDLCKGCRLCAKACPFKVITMVQGQGKKRVALKCTYCAEHEEGPACVRSCPTNALLIALPTKQVT